MSFTTTELQGLFAAILVNDVVDSAVELPDAVRVDYPAGHLSDGFAISRDLWVAGFDRDGLIALAAKLARDATINAYEQERFKHVRAKFKHLRFAFVLYGREHRCPPAFKAVTTAMGHLQDAFRSGRHGAARRYAVLLRLLLTPPATASLRREIDRIKLSDSDDFRAFTLAQIGELRALIERDAITGHQFHAARKIVSRQVSFHDDMRTIHPTPEHHILSRYLSAINGLMGQHHDELVARKVRSELDYARATFPLPPDIRARLSALVERF